MGEAVAASAVAITAAVMGLAPTPTPSPPLDAAPVLTSAPFGALPGQQVTHTVTIAGTATLVAARITFTTTADLERVTARAQPGWCSVTAREVVCDLGDIRLASGSPAPRITITGRVRPGATPGTVVRNRVSLTSDQMPENEAQIASNAYLVPGSTATPTDPPTEPQAAAPVGPAAPRSMRVPTVLAVVVAGVAAAGAVLTRRRLRQRRAESVTTGRPDPM
ncbi:hypothetical protein ONA91_19835 [Micromonospora sp. DR5-3]|uniref:hypothetical protein n=1 Tax=unclassified Micromonospora TaxID=2617518 RepID=UPI0011D7720D|nr:MULTISPECIES: hypothetical protein [unclassified Micromonospora]MCW3816700.1 hypothetical protein [Micromonospora sp. DR5-3]TYC22563.1 hypothetical protein FXF52_20135 [Micromonospora sp. MP36]